MLRWRSKLENVATQLPDLAQLRQQALVVIFKHSPTCPVSWAAEKQVKRFTANNPSVPVETILVRQDRELSRQIAEFTGIRHESPQVIVMRHGVPVGNASHQDVTADYLESAIHHCVGSK
jgi:bacillithiol system protein YtxJ